MRAFSHPLQGLLHAHQARQALGASAAGQQAQLDLGQAEAGAAIINHDAPVAAHRNFQPATQAQTVQDGDHRLAAAFQPADEALEAHGLVKGFLRGAEGAQAVHIGTGQKVFLGRAQDQAFDAGIAFQPGRQGDQRRGQLIRQDVHRVAGQVHGGDEDGVGAEFEVECLGGWV